MAAQACDLSTGRWRLEKQKFKIVLLYTRSSNPSWDIGDPFSWKKKEKKEGTAWRLLHNMHKSNNIRLKVYF